VTRAKVVRFLLFLWASGCFSMAVLAIVLAGHQWLGWNDGPGGTSP
jgi:hypothetical protein